MQKANITSETVHYINCPHCNKGKSDITYLLNTGDRTFGPWFCDECGKAYNGKVVEQEVFVQKIEREQKKSIVLLKKGNVLLCIDHKFEYHNTPDEDRFFYEEHTCPTNYLNNVIMVVDLDTGDNDPHGIFEYVATLSPEHFEAVENKIQLLDIN